jgi:hypothetical protein
MMKNVYLRTFTDICVTVKNSAGQELRDEHYSVETDDDEVIIVLEGGCQIATADVLPIVSRIRELAEEKMPEFLPILDKFQREVEMEWLRSVAAR